MTSFPSGTLALPEDVPAPGVVVVGGAGTPPADRFAAEGYVALQLYPDAGGADAAAAVAFITGRPECTGRIGVVGLGTGAAVALRAAADAGGIAAVVAFGRLDPTVGRYGRVAALVHCSEEDGTSDAEVVQALRRGIEAAGGSVTLHDYPGTRSAFYDETRPDAFDEMQADEAWGRTFDFLAEELRR